MPTEKSILADGDGGGLRFPDSRAAGIGFRRTEGRFMLRTRSARDLSGLADSDAGTRPIWGRRTPAGLLGRT
jgi:hypothetical protein